MFGGKYPQGICDFEVEAQWCPICAVWSLAPATDITTGLRWEMTDYDYKIMRLIARLSRGYYRGFLFRVASRSDDFSDISPKLVYYRLADNRHFANWASAAPRPGLDLYRRDSNRTDGNAPDVSAIIQKPRQSRDWLYYRIGCPMETLLSSCRKKIITSAMPQIIT